jgi:3-dehydroquinate synthase
MPSQLLYGIDQLKDIGSRYTEVFILVDTHTRMLCLPLVEALVPCATIIEISAGESQKNIVTCEYIWQQLLQHEATRKALLINLGGGVITDMGGFCAASYKRGIHFINIPTTLLAMVDASFGGKTGINVGGLKNSVGVFAEPQYTIIDTAFLTTLDERQIYNGYAEMLKHALIADTAYWAELRNLPPTHVSLPLIQKSIEIKQRIVSQDPYEEGMRKLLNFGHTIGHAIEAACLHDESTTILHGEAVAWGMVAEAYISTKVCGLPVAAFEEIKKVIYHLYQKPTGQSAEALLQLMKNDKKRSEDQYNITTLKKIGEGAENILVSEDVILESFKHIF